MSRREDRVALLHMRDHAAEAVENMRGRSRSDLDVELPEILEQLEAILAEEHKNGW